MRLVKALELKSIEIVNKTGHNTQNNNPKKATANAQNNSRAQKFSRNVK